MAKDIKVFVYGTLKKKQRNHYVMEKIGAEYLCEAVTSDARYVLNESPSWTSPGRFTPAVHKAINEEIAHAIAGEIYHIDKEGLVILDEFEQVGEHYMREEINVISNQNLLKANIYIKMGVRGKTHDAHFIRGDIEKNIYSWAEF